MSKETIAELMQELVPELGIFTKGGPQKVEDLVQSYGTCRLLITEIESDDAYGHSGYESAVTGLKDGLISSFNSNMKDLVSGVYKDVQEELAGAKSLSDKATAVAEGKLLLEQIQHFPEHADNSFLVKVVSALEAYETKLDGVFLKEEETRFGCRSAITANSTI